jgi:hypothetical protein
MTNYIGLTKCQMEQVATKSTRRPNQMSCRSCRPKQNRLIEIEVQKQMSCRQTAITWNPCRRRQ